MEVARRFSTRCVARARAPYGVFSALRGFELQSVRRAQRVLQRGPTCFAAKNADGTALSQGLEQRASCVKGVTTSQGCLSSAEVAPK